MIYYIYNIMYIHKINKSYLIFHVVKHGIMEKLINKCIFFCEKFPKHHILDNFRYIYIYI